MGGVANQTALTVRLSPRQRECLRLVYRRRTSKEIAAELGLSPGTVHTYIAEAVASLGAQNRRHAAEILYVAEQGSAEAPPSEVELESAGVPGTMPAAVVGDPVSSHVEWRRLLPFRSHGAADNDLPVLARLLWVPILAVLLAIGFGAVIGGLGVLSDLLGRPHS